MAVVAGPLVTTAVATLEMTVQGRGATHLDYEQTTVVQWITTRHAVHDSFTLAAKNVRHFQLRVMGPMVNGIAAA